MIEATERRRGQIQGLPPRRAEGGMAEIVGQCHRLRQILVQGQDSGDGAGDLSNLDAMGEACAVMVPLVIDENLGLMLQPAKGGRMKDPVAIALKSRAHRAPPLGLEGGAAVPRAACTRG